MAPLDVGTQGHGGTLDDVLTVLVGLHPATLTGADRATVQKIAKCATALADEDQDQEDAGERQRAPPLPSPASDTRRPGHPSRYSSRRFVGRSTCRTSMPR